jgi:hypothetical protein
VNNDGEVEGSAGEGDGMNRIDRMNGMKAISD